MVDWDQYFMQFAELASSRSHCLRRKVGAVLVKERMVIATGYNGPPRNIEHCTRCLRTAMNVPSGERHELCIGLHAEQNVIIQSAYNGVCIRDSALYTYTYPCSICCKMIINAGIKEIVYREHYHDFLTEKLLTQVPAIVIRKL